MNSDHTVEVMALLRSETDNCPQCSTQFPKHDTSCSFNDFQFLEILAVVAMQPEIQPSDFDDKLKEFIKERTSKPYFGDAACYLFTIDTVYPVLDITDEELEKLAKNRSSLYRIWVKVGKLMKKKTFFKNTDAANASRGTQIYKLLQLVYDIKIGAVSTTQNQKYILWCIIYYIQQWLSTC